MYYRTLYTIETLKKEIENVAIYISDDNNQMDDFILILENVVNKNYTDSGNV